MDIKERATMEQLAEEYWQKCCVWELETELSLKIHKLLVLIR